MRGFQAFRATCLTQVLVLGLVHSAAAHAQAPDTTPLPPDSARVADSLALVRELERLAGGAGQQRAQGGSRLLPDISLVGDLIFDLSSRGSTQEDRSRFGVREIELQIAAPVDPYFRGDVLVSYSDAEGVAVEQAILATTALPWHLELQLGRFFLPFGKQNLMHRESLHTIEYPWVLQRFLSPEALKGTGALLSRVLSPFGFFQEVQVSVMESFGEGPADLVPEEPANRHLAGLGYSARFRNYWDVSRHANLEISLSAATGKTPQPIETGMEVNAVNARRTVLGADFTYRWRPLQQGLYRSFILQAEYLRQVHDGSPDLPDGVMPAQYLGPRRAYDGAYLFTRYQITRRTYLGARGDLVEDPEADGRTQWAASGYWEFYPSEFSKLLLGFERVMPQDQPGYNRLILQATFALGPHRPHPF